jgi:hypothetical protein
MFVTTFLTSLSKECWLAFYEVHLNGKRISEARKLLGGCRAGMEALLAYAYWAMWRKAQVVFPRDFLRTVLPPHPSYPDHAAKFAYWYAGKRTLDQKLTHFRWLVRKIGKANLLPRENRDLGIERGPRHTRAGKFIIQERLQEILDGVADDPRRRMAVLLGRYLGLRFREAMLFRPWRDWEECGRIWVKRGTKGGRPRYLFLWNPRQREILEEARALVHGQDAALIPEEAATWEQWRQASYHKLRKAGMSRETDTVFHDLRRTWAGERMHYLIRVRGLDQERAERIVTRELGHNRREVLRWYLEDQDLVAAA